MVLIPTVNVQSMTKEELLKRVEELDKTLSTVPLIVSLEKQLGIHKVHLAGLSTFGLLIFLLVFNNLYANLLTDVCGYIYPSYMSLKAVGGEKDVQTQWLAYWAAFGFFNLLEYGIDYVLYVFPFYYTFKLIIIVWLASPATKGASAVYNTVLKPLLPHVDSLGTTLVPTPAAPPAAAPAAEGEGEKAAPAGGGGKPESAPAGDKADKKEGGGDKKAEGEGKAKTGKVRWGYSRVR
ncbi:uncharacterized protein SPPG_07600 [Spizellomyces punctatus DAOM BR117]|uniref:Protein YOP1 n=1 Tax=Spizellomyces punctatus (strain DAOM BR117) TaxID=645134 RepID=A0A0L0H976_SPIPD|nr:uncharacterized protein SPPG_07600 [Spizellomyces punctatus DAOM BR117]KNC97213.1 hypothetical protein SPPG_07600 [Spizellomyces punctatus DAOM BR117]|eukprot:XP_016605253.1 hypothetical protein SPPG_07600 [Spizellomyces punctatus DAOM BR117]